MKTALATLILCLSAVAFAANRTITYLTAGSEVLSMSFELTTPGQVNAAVCGHAPIQGGGAGIFGPITCYQVALTSGGVFTAITGLAAGGALTFWQGMERL